MKHTKQSYHQKLSNDNSIICDSQSKILTLLNLDTQRYNEQDNNGNNFKTIQQFLNYKNKKEISLIQSMNQIIKNKCYHPSYRQQSTKHINLKNPQQYSQRQKILQSSIQKIRYQHEKYKNAIYVNQKNKHSLTPNLQKISITPSSDTTPFRLSESLQIKQNKQRKIRYYNQIPQRTSSKKQNYQVKKNVSALKNIIDDKNNQINSLNLLVQELRKKIYQNQKTKQEQSASLTQNIYETTNRKVTDQNKAQQLIQLAYMKPNTFHQKFIKLQIQNHKTCTSQISHFYINQINNLKKKIKSQSQELKITKNMNAHLQKIISNHIITIKNSGNKRQEDDNIISAKNLTKIKQLLLTIKSLEDQIQKYKKEQKNIKNKFKKLQQEFNQLVIVNSQLRNKNLLLQNKVNYYQQFDQKIQREQYLEIQNQLRKDLKIKQQESFKLKMQKQLYESRNIKRSQILKKQMQQISKIQHILQKTSIS